MRLVVTVEELVVILFDEQLENSTEETSKLPPNLHKADFGF